MAGDWIKMRSALPTCPKTAAMVRALHASDELRGLSRHVVRLLVVGGLHAAWSAVNEHTSDGVMANAHLEDVDDIVGITGFGAAMQAAGWLEVDDAAATLTFPNFGQWNTPAKDSTAAERMRKHREKQRSAQQPVTVTAPLRVTVAPDKTRQDKREDIPAAPVATSEPPKRRTRSQPPDPVRWDAVAGWTGITDADRQEWATAFPACVLATELAKATAWLRANPQRAHKSNWRRFIVSWLTRSQDKGGTNREPGRRPEDVDRKAHLERKAAEFAEMRPAPYRRPAEVVALATSLKVTEDT